jgi:predicted nuclease with TOPRIM domain
MNQHIIFDRTRYTDKLRDNGVDEKTARAHSDALDGALRDAVATRSDIVELRTEFKSDLLELRTELKSDIQELRAELKSDIQELRTEIRDLEGRMDAKFADVDSRFAEVNVKFAEQSTKIETAKLDILRWLIATQLALAGLVIGVMLKFMK